MTFSVMRFWCHRAAWQLSQWKFSEIDILRALGLRQVKGESQAGWGPSRSGFQTEGDSEGDRSVCLGNSFFVSNDCLKIERVFKSAQDGAVEKPALWRKILHALRVERERQVALSRRLR